MVLSWGSGPSKSFGEVLALHLAARPPYLKGSIPTCPWAWFAHGFTSSMDEELCKGIILHRHGDFVVQEPRSPSLSRRHDCCWSLLSFFWLECPNLGLQAYADAGLSLPLHVTPKTESKHNRASAAPVGQGLYSGPWEEGVPAKDARGEISWKHLHPPTMLVCLLGKVCAAPLSSLGTNRR